jgi:hypothetical protein
VIDPVSLAKLAADERTPDHERAAAAMALAKLVAKNGMPAGPDALPRHVVDLQRQLDALAVIAGQQAEELRTLRAEKADLEAQLAKRGRT